jgi:NADH-quinone oxidoreductase subunit K
VTWAASQVLVLPQAFTLLGAVPLDRTVLLACALFAVGLVGVTCRRNVLIVLLSVEILLNAANLVFVAFSKVHGDVTGQVFVFFAMTVAAAEVAVGLAIVIAVYRLRRSTDVADACDLRDRDHGPNPPLKLEGEDQHHDDHHGGDDHAHDDHGAEGEAGAHAAQRGEHAPAGAHGHAPAGGH